MKICHTGILQGKQLKRLDKMLVDPKSTKPKKLFNPKNKRLVGRKND